ncbi:hypothetical protein NE237_002590 [Protea cynaroides]|uniref:Uncharacterized protein n=1 Tax=Protea cynaroides TaxID=273540 RepID=A0A9Q0KWE8_9MAGN|nr:hypothetical protein NE237_002590 [Protea cynaroides]
MKNLMLYSKKLSEVEIHPHIYMIVGTTNDQFSLAPSDRMCIVLHDPRQCWRERSGENTNSRSPETSTDLLNQTSKSRFFFSICASEHQRSRYEQNRRSLAS